MKNLFLMSAFAFTTMLFFSSCNKEQTTYDNYFYTSIDTNDVRLVLFIDNSFKGNLPYIKNKPTCDSTDLKTQCLNLAITEGKHTLTAKDHQGNIKSEIIFSQKTNVFGTEKMSGKSQTGGGENSKKGNCIIHNLFY